jgi:hypothetical protein
MFALLEKSGQKGDSIELSIQKVGLQEPNSKVELQLFTDVLPLS